MGMGLGVSSQTTKMQNIMIIIKLLLKLYRRVFLEGCSSFNYWVIFLFFPVGSMFLRSFLKLQLPLT